MYINKTRACDIMRKAKIDVLVATTPQNVVYFSGFCSMGQWCLPGTQAYAVFSLKDIHKPSLVIPHGEADIIVEQGLDALSIKSAGTVYCEGGDLSKHSQADRALWKMYKNPKGSHSSSLKALAEIIEEVGAKRVAIDERGLMPGGFALLKEAMPSIEIISGYGLIQQIRAVKTPKEIELLRRAVHVTEGAMQRCLAEARVGMTEKEMERIFQTYLTTEGAQPLFNVILFGTRSAYPNGMPSDSQLKKGDIIRFDIGCTYQKYTSDIARIAVFGKPTDKIIGYYDAILAGQERALKAIIPGVTADLLFEEAVKEVRKSGIPHYKRQHVGHGIGIEVYDPPLLAPNNQQTLEAGMVIDVETPYYELGFGGLQVEDTVVVTNDGYEFLTRTSRELMLIS